MLVFQMVGDEIRVTLDYCLALKAHMVLNLCAEVHHGFHFAFDTMDFANMSVDFQVVSPLFAPAAHVGAGTVPPSKLSRSVKGLCGCKGIMPIIIMITHGQVKDFPF